MSSKVKDAWADEVKPGHLLTYNQSKCFVCEKVFTSSIYLRLEKKNLIICNGCAKDLKEALP